MVPVAVWSVLTISMGGLQNGVVGRRTAAVGHHTAVVGEPTGVVRYPSAALTQSTAVVGRRQQLWAECTAVVPEAPSVMLQACCSHALSIAA